MTDKKENEGLKTNPDDWLSDISDPFQDVKITMDEYIKQSPFLSKMAQTRQGKIVYFLTVITVFLMQSLSKVLIPVLNGEVPVTFEMFFAISILVLGVIGYSFGNKLLLSLDNRTLRGHLENGQKLFNMQIQKQQEERKHWNWKREKELKLDSHIRSEARIQRKFDEAMKLRGKIYSDLLHKLDPDASPLPEIPISTCEALERMDANLFMSEGEAMRTLQTQQILEKIDEHTNEQYELAKQNNKELLKNNEYIIRALGEVKDLWKEIQRIKLILQQNDIIPIVNLEKEIEKDDIEKEK